jgi:hypothetical protein
MSRNEKEQKIQWERKGVKIIKVKDNTRPDQSVLITKDSSSKASWALLFIKKKWNELYEFKTNFQKV